MCYCTVFALYSFEFEGNFRVQASGGCGGTIYRRVLRYDFFFLLGGGRGGLIFGGAYTRRGLFSEFYGMSLFNKAVLSKYDLSDRRGLFQR